MRLCDRRRLVYRRRGSGAHDDGRGRALRLCEPGSWALRLRAGGRLAYRRRTGRAGDDGCGCALRLREGGRLGLRPRGDRRRCVLNDGGCLGALLHERLRRVRRRGERMERLRGRRTRRDRRNGRALRIALRLRARNDRNGAAHHDRVREVRGGDGCRPLVPAVAERRARYGAHRVRVLRVAINGAHVARIIRGVGARTAAPPWVRLFARRERYPGDRIGERDGQTATTETDESHERRRPRLRGLRARARGPRPAIPALIAVPAAVVKRRIAPRRVVDPGPAVIGLGRPLTGAVR